MITQEIVCHVDIIKWRGRDLVLMVEFAFESDITQLKYRRIGRKQILVDISLISLYRWVFQNRGGSDG